jgi:hypothetical protein
MGKHNIPALGQVIIVEDAIIGAGHKLGQQLFALKEWPRTLILTVMLDEIKGEQDSPHTPRRGLELVEKGKPVRADHDHLAV